MSAACVCSYCYLYLLNVLFPALFCHNLYQHHYLRCSWEASFVLLPDFHCTSLESRDLLVALTLLNIQHEPIIRTDPVAAGVACDVSGQLRGCQYGRPSSMPSSASAAFMTSARGLRNEIDIIVESRRVERGRRAAGRHAARGPTARRSSLARSASSSSTQAMGWFDRIRPRKTPIPSLLVFLATLCCISSVLTHHDKGMRGNGIVLLNFSLPCLDFREAH